LLIKKLFTMKKGSEYENMTRDELYEMAKEREIPGKSDMNKEQLIQALSKAEDGGGGGKGERKEEQKSEHKSGSHSRHSGGGQREKDPAPAGSDPSEYKNIPGNQS
jgi:Rho termination factor, N-terminal domain